MARAPKQQPSAKLIQEIQKRYGSTIDLKKSPGVLIEIIRNYARLVVGDDPPGTSTVAVGITSGTGGGGGTGSGGMGSGGTSSGGTGTGGTNSGTSTVAVGITPGEGVGSATNEVILQAILNLHRDIKAIAKSTGTKIQTKVRR